MCFSEKCNKARNLSFFRNDLFKDTHFTKWSKNISNFFYSYEDFVLVGNNAVSNAIKRESHVVYGYFWGAVGAAKISLLSIKEVHCLSSNLRWEALAPINFETLGIAPIKNIKFPSLGWGRGIDCRTLTRGNRLHGFGCEAPKTAPKASL